MFGVGAVRYAVFCAPLLVAAVACSQQASERPAYAELSCEGRNCKPQGGSTPVGVGGTPSAQTSEDRDESSAGPNVGGDAGADIVSLDPQEATDLQRTSGAPIGRPYALYAWPELDAPILRSQGLDAEPVSLSADGGWLLVLVTDSADALDPTWLPTLSWQRPSLDPVTVPVFRTQFWVDLAAGLALTPTTLDPQSSHLLVQVTDDIGQPLVGVSAQVVSGAVAYGNGGSASDALTETDDSGVLVWLNAPAGPGTTLTLTTGSDLWSVVIPTRAASVTVAAVAHSAP